MKKTPMLRGAHVLLYSRDPDADRAFFRDVLELRSVDAGGGWLIFGLPPAEVALHPADDVPTIKHGKRSMLTAVLYWMCDDLAATMTRLKGRGVKCGKIAKERWGLRTSIVLPSGGELGLYQPTHPTALGD